jgi:hypothetical protein
MMPPAGDRLYLGWQYATPHPDPGPPPRRPTPPEAERLNPAWAAAQRREESLLNRPLKAAFGTAAVVGAISVLAAAARWLPILAAGLAVVVCVLVAAVCGYGLWQGQRALRSRLADEQARVGKIRAAQQSELSAWQAVHARRVRDWQAQRIAHEHQKRWYGVSVPGGITRVDVAGGTLSGWSAMLATAAGHRLAAGAEVTVLDLTEGSVALDLIASAREAGLDPQVWVLPEDLPALGLGAGLDGRELADVLSLVAGSTAEQGSTRDLAFDHAILERVVAVLGGTATVAGVAAALRALAQAGDPREDIAAGVISSAQVDRLATMFGRGAADRVVVERAWVLESQLRTLAAVGTGPAAGPRGPLRVLAVSPRSGSVEGMVLSTYLAVMAAHTQRAAPPGQPWRHTLFVLAADRLRGDTLDRLVAACEKTGTGLVLAYRSVPPHVKQRLGRGNAAVAFMRLGNADDARAASEQLGTEHRFVLSQLTETVGLSVTDSTAGSYTSTAGSVSSLAESWSVSQASTRGTSRGRTGHGAMPVPAGSSAGTQTSDSRSTAASGSASTGINTSTSWGQTTSRAAGDSQSLAAALQRSREFLVEQHELQQLPPSAMIISYAGAGGRQVVLADANPGIGGLRAATWVTLDELASRPVAPRARQAPQSHGPPAAAGPPASWRAGDGRPPPNLGPPPPRLDWRRRRT